MNPEAASSQDLFATLLHHKGTVQCHKAALVQQEALMARHSQLMSEMLTSIKQISDRLPPATAPTPVPQIQVPMAVNLLAEPHLPPSQLFSGDPSACKGFFHPMFSLLRAATLVVSHRPVQDRIYHHPAIGKSPGLGYCCVGYPKSLLCQLLCLC
jgi:hypothetical protein